MEPKLIVVIVALVCVVAVLGLFVSKEGITGGVIVNTIACHDNTDCDDGIARTEDICKNQGTVSALCFNRPQ